ncbi:MAG: EpsI family protein [Gammaproteobacteria bacterium]|nr:EpsI family protein [Gammaproteobacteria bacterium]
MQLDQGWTGQSEPIEEIYLESLNLDDYVMADFRRAGSARVNFYTAFYASQLAGKSAHSPRSCLPGGGWELTELETMSLPDPRTGAPVPINRALIQRGTASQLVYYWFEQRGRVLANEYLVKWYIFIDALQRSRTDGALVRLVVPITPPGGVVEADAALTEFFGQVKTRLHRYVPE